MGTMYFGQPEYADVCLSLVNEAHKVSKHTSVCYHNPLFMGIRVYLGFHCARYTHSYSFSAGFRFTTAVLHSQNCTVSL